MTEIMVIKKDGTRLKGTSELPELLNYRGIQEVVIQGWRFFPYSAPPEIHEEVEFLKSIIKKLVSDNGAKK